MVLRVLGVPSSMLDTCDMQAAERGRGRKVAAAPTCLSAEAL